MLSNNHDDRPVELARSTWRHLLNRHQQPHAREGRHDADHDPASRYPAIRASMVGAERGLATKAMRLEPSCNKCLVTWNPVRRLSIPTRSYPDLSG